MEILWNASTTNVKVILLGMAENNVQINYDNPSQNMKYCENFDSDLFTEMICLAT